LTTKSTNQVNRFHNLKFLCLLTILSFATASAFSFSSASSPTPSHTILFDEIGQMASSMTYIHIAIPLNITTFQHQINVFSSYLENFINLKTDKKNQILFTKTIRDLATFADSRLLTLAEKVKYIDHILPSDTANFASRQKRFFMIAPYIMCKEDLAYCRDQREKESAKARLDISNCQVLLTECETHKNNYPDFPEFHAAYFNATYPATTTPPPVTFRAFRPTSAPYNATREKRSLNFSPFSQKQTFLELVNASHPISRPKRQLLAGAGFLSGVVGTFLGLYNTYELHKIQKQLLHYADQQNLLTNIALKHEHILQELNKDLTHLTDIVQTLIMYNPALVYAKLEQNVKLIEDRITILFNTLQQLQQHRLAVNLLDENQMTVLVNAVRNTAKNKNLQIIPTHTTDFFQLDTSYIRVNNDVLILLHVPCLTSNHMLTLYRYVPFPYPVSTFSSPSLDPHTHIHLTNDILSKYNSHNRTSLFFVPETELIAVGRNSLNGNARYQLVSQAILAGCIQQNHIFLCDRHHVLRKDLEGSCLGALFIQHQQGVIENCKVEYKPLRETVYQLSTNDHLIYSPNPLTTQILCANGSHFPQQLVEITKIHVPDYCSIDLINNTIHSDGNIKLTPKPLQMFMTLDTNIFPSEMMNSIEHADDEMNSIKQSLKSLANMTTSDEIFNNMLVTHLTAPNPVSILLWTITAFSFAGYTFFFCWYCNALRHRRAALRRRRRNLDDDAETGIPLTDVDSPERLDGEDEIAFIARTGIVKDPPAKTSGQK
jgi:phosphopantetheine adenylyltransferase